MPATNMEEIAQKLKKLKFRKKTFGGVDERDVWKKLSSLQEDYRNAFLVQHEKDMALVEDRDKKINILKEELKKVQSQYETDRSQPEVKNHG